MKNFYKKLLLWVSKKIWACFLITSILLSSVITLVMFVGSDKIIYYIQQNVQKIENRGLNYGIDTDGNLYLQNNDDSKKMKILALSDLHLCASVTTFKLDKMLVEAVVKIVESVKPDLIVLIGDVIYPSPDKLIVNNKNSLHAVGTMFERFEIPWAIAYGNHDADKYATLQKSQLSDYYESLPHCLFQRGPNITGEGNYIIKLLSASGKLSSALFVLDSNGYVAPFVYDIVHDDQVAWYEQEVKKLVDSNNQIVPTHLFVHIPLLEYKIAWELYQQGSNLVEYHFGIKGRKRISCNPFGGGLFGAIVKHGSTKAVYCGHDHTHNFSITYQGVRLTYNMSMDYTAYYGISKRTVQRGGTLIEIDTQNNGAHEMFQVPEDNNYMPVYE